MAVNDFVDELDLSNEALSFVTEQRNSLLVQNDWLRATVIRYQEALIKISILEYAGEAGEIALDAIWLRDRATQRG